VSPDVDLARRAADLSPEPRGYALPGGSDAWEFGAGLRDYLEILARRRWLAIGVFLVIMVLTILSILRTRPVYEARASVMVTASNQSSVLGGVPLFWSNQPVLADHIALLTSRSLAERVAQALPDSIALSAATLQGMATARGSRDGNVITVSASAPKRPLAVALANAYADAYQQYDLDLSRLDVSAVRQFVEGQLGTVGGRLDSSERGLAQFKSVNKLVDVSTETRSLIDQQAVLAAQYQQSLIDEEATRTELAHIQRRIEQEGRGIADVSGITSPLVTSLKNTLNQLEVEKTNLIIRGFSENSERIQGLNRQIDSTRARLRTESQVLVSQQGLADPVGHLGSLFESSLTLNTRLAATKARQEALASAMAGYDAPLSRLPDAERRLARLTRDVETGRRVHSLLSERFEEARIQEVGRISSVRIIDRAQRASQTRPNVRNSLAVGLVLALAAALGSVWAAEQLDTSLHGQHELERRGYTVLGSIPKLLTAGKSWRGRREEDVRSHLITHTDVESSGAEAFRILRTALGFASAERPLRTIVVTSPGPSEGKSTVSVNLASVLAQAGARVLLIDADLRHPMLHNVFRRRKKPGLSDLIISQSGEDQAIFSAGIDGLFCLPCGTIPPSPADLFTLNSARALFKRLAETYDYVVIDTPPVLVAADSPIIAALADTTIMVVRAGRTAREALQHAYASLISGGAHLSGLVLNDISRSGRYGRYYYYYYKYRYRYYRHTPDATRPGDMKPEEPLAGSRESEAQAPGADDKGPKDSVV